MRVGANDNWNSTLKSNTCNPTKELSRSIFSCSDEDRVQLVYVFSVQLVVGVLGNALILLVMNSKGMRTKTNCFLSAMAVADLIFFMVRFPMNLHCVDIFSKCADCLRSIMIYHPTLTTLANGFSAASIWLTVGVTIERLIAVCSPLHAKAYLQRSRIIASIITIFVFAMVINLYNIVWRIPRKRPKVAENCTIVGTMIEWDQDVAKMFVSVSHAVATVLMVIAPLVTLIVLNCVLIYFLRRNRQGMQEKQAFASTSTDRMRTNERKVTLMVLVIIVTFILLNTPSAVIAFMQTALNISVKSIPKSAYIVSNTLVNTGKAINFLLYCTASVHFRRRLLHLICRHTPIRRYIGSDKMSVGSHRSSRFTVEISASPSLIRKRLRSSQRTCNSTHMHSADVSATSSRSQSKGSVEGGATATGSGCTWDTHSDRKSEYENHNGISGHASPTARARTTSFHGMVQGQDERVPMLLTAHKSSEPTFTERRSDSRGPRPSAHRVDTVTFKQTVL